MDKEKRDILIVDDEEATLFAYKDILSEPWLTIDTAPSLEKAKQLIGGKSYHGAVIDIRLNGTGDSGGFQAIQLIKKYNPQCKIIVLTGYAQADTKDSAFNLGADFFMEKPVSPEEIKKIFQTLGVF